MIPEEIARRERLNLIRAHELNPYPAESHRTKLAIEVIDGFADLEKTGESFFLCGRIRAIRKHGGLTFLELEDGSGKIQIVVRRDDIGIEPYDFFHTSADVGDFFEVMGTAYRTNRGEESVLISNIHMLGKSLLPLPEKFHGLQDTEKRYRYRYLDLLANPEVKDLAILRSKIVAAIRSFLETEGFLEVETPILQPMAGGANARPFKTRHHTLHHDFYLRIAPELYLKRLLVGGFEKIYEYARCFRNEGISQQHNPEFTQIELYWAYATIEDLMAHLERLLAFVQERISGQKVMFTFPLPRHSYHDLILEHAKIDIDEYQTEESLKKAIEDIGLKTEGIIGIGDLLDHLYKERVRPHLLEPQFVTDYPTALKPLAKARENPRYSSCAQLLIGGVEVWNAFNELNDPVEQEERFREQEVLRERGSEDAQQIDHVFLKALKHGMPPAAGYGLGIDRLVMILSGAENLKEVILFPTLKPNHESEEHEEGDV
ncbi:MAG: lysine--tRNA ligase [Patescibacteria group bacterium]|jgi:lysyl-tRNA synthetase class 2